MKPFRKSRLTAMLCGLGLGLSTLAVAHDIDEAGLPVCLEGNYMMADAMNAPFSSNPGPGRVIEMNIITGTPGITVDSPFNPGNVGTPICPDSVACPGPWKPTGVASGGLNGHPMITGAAQGVLTEFHRDGKPIRTIKFPTRPAGDAFGSVPRPLGSQFMPNGNFIQTICDANFFNAPNSDPIGPGDPDPAGNGNSSNLFFPPVYSTPERAANSRLLVLDQESLEVIDEYSQPAEGELGHDLWGCMADVFFSDEGMFVSLFHGAAILVIDWKAGLDNEHSEGVGSNSKDKNDDDGDDATESFKLDKPKNRAKVTRIIDLRPGTPYDDPSRRDSLRAAVFDESGNIYATDRARSRDCLKYEAPGANIHGETPCNPSVFRQRVNIVAFGDDHPSRTLALDPGVNVIAGIRTNRMSAVACDHVMANKHVFATEYNPLGYAPEEDLCDVETLLVAASSMNPGDILDGCGGAGPNPCFMDANGVPHGGGVVEYLIHPNWVDGGPGWGGGGCNGDPFDVAGNQGCAQPVATFEYRGPTDTDPVQTVDPRMLMVIHEPFIQ